jgi:predicted phosphodiesterase
VPLGTASMSRMTALALRSTRCVLTVVFGHSHMPLAERRDGILYLNPGSAGPRRFRLPITVARLHVSADCLRPEIVPLPIP